MPIEAIIQLLESLAPIVIQVVPGIESAITTIIRLSKLQTTLTDEQQAQIDAALADINAQLDAAVQARLAQDG